MAKPNTHYTSACPDIIKHIIMMHMCKASKVVPGIQAAPVGYPELRRLVGPH